MVVIVVAVRITPIVLILIFSSSLYYSYIIVFGFRYSLVRFSVGDSSISERPSAVFRGCKFGFHTGKVRF